MVPTLVSKDIHLAFRHQHHFRKDAFTFNLVPNKKHLESHAMHSWASVNTAKEITINIQIPWCLLSAHLLPSCTLQQPSLLSLTRPYTHIFEFSCLFILILLHLMQWDKNLTSVYSMHQNKVMNCRIKMFHLKFFY